jgi:tyrosyl-tRNA synthetase
MQAGRTLLQDLAEKESFVLVTGYLEGTDGRKMSKTWGNAIWINDEPNDMYGKVMSIKDELIVQYFLLVTNTPEPEIKEIDEALSKGQNPMTFKEKLAFTIVKELHSEEKANTAASYFKSTFKEGKLPHDIETISLEQDTYESTDLLVESGIVESKTQAKKLINDGAVDFGGVTIKDIKEKVTIPSEGLVIRVGKKRFIKVQTA